MIIIPNLRSSVFAASFAALSLAVTTLFVVGLASPVIAQTNANESPVGKLTRQYKSALAKACVPVDTKHSQLNQDYLLRLEAQEATLMKEGDLDNLLKVKKERELFEKSHSLGADPLPALKKLRADYQTSLTTIAAERSEITTRYKGVYRAQLLKLQEDLTKAGNLEAAIEAKNTLENLVKAAKASSTPPAAAPAPAPANSVAASDLVVDTVSPWNNDPPVDEKFFDGGVVLQNVKVPEGDHRLRAKVIMGERDPVKAVTVYFRPKTTISSTGDGLMMLTVGHAKAYDVTFERCRLAGGLGAYWHLINCRLDRTILYKGDTWRAKPHACEWDMKNCLVEGDFASRWTTKNIGYQVRITTFDGVKFPDLIYHDDAGLIAGKEKLRFVNCPFKNCDIPLSVLITTINCGFIDCSFRDDDSTLNLKTPIGVTVFAKDSTSRLRNLTSKIKVDIRPFEEATGKLGQQPLP